MAVIICNNCNFSMEGTLPADRPLYCIMCGHLLAYTAEPDNKAQPADVPVAPPRIQEIPRAAERHTFSFSGSGGEYFRIWIVNLFLTVITLGIYAAWAKVRNRRYIWANTTLAGHPFTFHGNPAAILRGNLIIAAMFIAYMATEKFEPMLAGIVVFIFTFIFPILVCKSLRFNAHNTSYRNIRFKFLGTLGGSFETYLLFGGIVPFTLFLFFPAWQYYKKRYFLNNLAYGTAGSTFTGRKGPFYKAYFVAFIIGVSCLVALAVLSGLLTHHISRGPGGTPGKFIFLYYIFFMYVIGAAIWYTLQAYIYTVTMNHCWVETRLGRTGFISTLRAGSLLWIRITNMAAIFFSCGLLIPWAKIRRTKYILENLTVVTSAGLDGFTAADSSEITAVGDAATDFMGIEIGL